MALSQNSLMENKTFNPLWIQTLALDLGLKPQQITATLDLLEAGGTVPFLARYRKEQTGQLDEVQITQIRDGYKRLLDLENRRSSILASIEEQGKLSPELRGQIEQALSLARLEDLYLPYKPKRRTKAEMAREKGLEPLAQWLLLQSSDQVLAQAERYLNPDKDLHKIEQVLQGARDIIAEQINEDADLRQNLRQQFQSQGQLSCRLVSDKAEDANAAKYKDYFEWDEPLNKAPSHRVLAMLRGEKEGFLRLQLQTDADQALARIQKQFLRESAPKPVAEQIILAAQDAYKRLLRPSLEHEVLNQAKEAADKTAIEVFARNLRDLLMASPLGHRPVLALDPGYRTGCKLVCLDAYGQLLHDEVLYLRNSAEQQKAALQLEHLVKRYKIEAIAIGNGTASRETEAFVRSLPQLGTAVVVVNESGASIYSASDLAREEFPDKDLTVRGAVSIGRRLMDPLAELVKLDPKSIGVGQYQHDVHQGELRQALDDTVMSCVNAVGVEVNLASKELLRYVAGLSEGLAGRIVAYRYEKGPFKTRRDLLKVPRLGPKAFEQAAGFLRIQNAVHPLDNSAVHPERYALVEQMAADLNCRLEDLMAREDLRRQIPLKRYLSSEVGLPTLEDILAELAKPGRDPRAEFEVFSFTAGIEKPEDLRLGQHLSGIVTNVTHFGAFVDVGVHQDGLVHISQLADRFVSDPMQVVKVGQKVKVWVVDLDLSRKRISLSMKKTYEAALGSLRS